MKRIAIKPVAARSLQMHHHRAEHWIVVSGTANLGGTLNVVQFGNFISPPGATFQVVRAGTINGTFASTNVPLIFSGLNASYTSQFVELGSATITTASTLTQVDPAIIKQDKELVATIKKLLGSDPVEEPELLVEFGVVSCVKPRCWKRPYWPSVSPRVLPSLKDWPGAQPAASLMSVMPSASMNARLMTEYWAGTSLRSSTRRPPVPTVLVLKLSSTASDTSKGVSRMVSAAVAAAVEGAAAVCACTTVGNASREMASSVLLS